MADGRKPKTTCPSCEELMVRLCQKLENPDFCMRMLEELKKADSPEAVRKIAKKMADYYGAERLTKILEEL